MQAIFSIEWFVGIAGRGRGLEGRQRFVGSESTDVDTLQLGRIHSPMKKVRIQTEPVYSTTTASSALGKSRDFTKRDALVPSAVPQPGKESLGMDPFLDNIVEYISPTGNGFSIDAAYS